MNTSDATMAILRELSRAKGKWPDWPIDPVHAVAVLAEESGELVQAALDYCYSGGDIDRIRDEAIQCGAMAVRVLEGLERYERRKGY